MNLLKDENVDLKFLKIFAIGSVAYLISHFFLFKAQSNFVTQIRMYLYLIMMADLASVYYLTYYYKQLEQPKDIETVDKKESEEQSEYENKKKIFEKITDEKNNQIEDEISTEKNDTQIPVFEKQ